MVCFVKSVVNCMLVLEKKKFLFLSYLLSSDNLYDWDWGRGVLHKKLLGDDKRGGIFNSWGGGR